MTAAVPFHSNNLLTRSDNEFAMCATQQIRNQPHFTPKFSSEHEYKLNKLLSIVKVTIRPYFATNVRKPKA